MPPTRSNRCTGPELQRAILDEARRILEQDGYAALSTRRIASAVGCTATSIYLYFKSKDALVHGLIDEGFVELNRRVIGAAEGPGTPLERLRTASLAYVEFGFERPEYYEIMFMLRAEQMERYPAEAYRRARRPLETFAEVTGFGPEEAARRGTMVWTTLHGLVSLFIAQRIDVRFDRATLVDDTIRSACKCALTVHPPDAADDITAN